MKKQIKILLVVIIILVAGIILTNYNANEKENKSLINLMDCSEAFMDNYFESMTGVTDEEHKNMLIVTSTNKIRDLYGAKKIIAAPNNQYMVIYNTEEEKKIAYEKLTSQKGIVNVEENTMYELDAYNSWGVEATGMDSAISIVEGLAGKEDIVVAIIDSGLDKELFEQNYPNKLAGVYNTYTDSTTTITDEGGHGTHVAGTVAECTPSNVKILPIKCATTSGLPLANILKAMYYIIYNNKANVINMSFGSISANIYMERAIEAATQAGIICVAAAGNDSASYLKYPASYEGVLAIAAVDSNFKPASFTNSGGYVDFAAPGVDIKSINGVNSGTSMASPHAAAAVAIVKSYNKNYTVEEVIKILSSNTVDLGTPGWDPKFGYGLINFKDYSYCSCNCSNCYSVSCDGCECLTCEYKDIKVGITGIELNQLVLEPYNYGSVSNLANTEIKIKYNSGYIVKKIYELEDVIITNYDPYKYISQEVTVNFEGKTLTITLPESTELESFWTYSLMEENKIKLTGMKATPVSWLYLPETIDEYVVSAIGNELFKEAKLGVVTMPETIISIGDRAFNLSGVYKLNAMAETLTLGKEAFSQAPNLNEITSKVILSGEYIFEECGNLTNIELSEQNTTIPNGTFYNCINLKEAVIPNNVTTIGDYAFYTTYLTSVVIPSKVTSIGTHAFENCHSLSNIDFPNTLTAIGNYAFKNCAILESLDIPANVQSIGNYAFNYCVSLKSIVVDSSNTTYDSRNNCNALIKTSSNELLLGCIITIIPEGVKKISNNAFEGIHNLSSITIPEGVEAIYTGAFSDMKNLGVVYMPRTVSQIWSNAFSKTPQELVFWVYSDSYAKTYVKRHSRIYKCYDPSSITVKGVPSSYKAFETIDISSAYLELEYLDSTGTRNETINEGIELTYPNGRTSLIGTDKSVTISAYNKMRIYVSTEFNITVSKLNPTYTVPTGLKAYKGQKLSEIALPEGFAWATPNTVITGTGIKKYTATYTPEDTDNYYTKTGISIEVNVTIPVITPTITIEDKVYDGTKNISSDDISVLELEKDEYEIVSAVLSSADIGEVIATIRIRLTDEKFGTITFKNGSQEYEANINIKVLPLKVQMPTSLDKTYTYNGKEQTFELNGYDSSLMNISGNIRTDAGTQTVIITLKNNNYVWSNGTRESLKFTFNIKKADIIYTASDTYNIMDGKSYGIEINVVSPLEAIIRYANNDGEYVLDSMPRYSIGGVHTIKFKIKNYMNDNYNDVYDERKVYISHIINNTKDKEVIYDSLEHTLDMDINLVDVNIHYSVNNENYNLTDIPKFKEVGEYTVNYKIEKEGIDPIYGSNKVKIYGIKEVDSTLSLNSSVLKIKDFNNNYLDIIKKIKVYAGIYWFVACDKNGSEKNESKVYTGDVLSLNITSGIENKELKYTLILLGDANLDGKISALDYVRIKNHIMKEHEIKEEISLLSSDANDDGKISALDYVRIKNYIMDGGK